MIRGSFFAKLFLFFLPLAAVVGTVLFVAVYSGEAMPPRIAYETQANSPGAIYMTSHRQYDFLYKYYAFDKVRPEVLFLGASRVLSFRAGFLNRNPEIAYNAGMGGMNMPVIETFLNDITPENAPKIMLLQVDQFWFNTNRPMPHTAATIDLIDIQPDQIVMQTRQVVRNIIKGTYTLDQLIGRINSDSGRLALGLHAMINGTGYAVDGGTQYRPQEQTPNIQKIRMDHALDQLHTQFNQFEQGDTVSEEAISSMERMLDRAVELNIEVIGFAPGYMPTLYSEMMESGKYGYMDKAMSQVAKLFEERGFHFFDFTDVRDFIPDYEMEDGNHSFEVASLRMYMRMIEGAPELLGQYSDLDVLQQMIDEAPTVMEVVPRE